MAAIASALAREDTRPAGQAVDAVLVEHARIDRGRLDDAAAGRQVPAREAHRRGHPLLARARGRGR